ncbi:MAG TPA: adenosylhomocysteinase [Thermoplasmatales archaeon]|nr:adenosylhomocysteinase [Thermoplasmatales archaeon]
MDYKVKDIGLAKEGEKIIRWAEQHMPVLMDIRKDFEKEKPLKGIKIAACLHVTKETGVLIKTLQAGGAEVTLTGSNPLSTNDSVAAYLAKNGVGVYAWRGNHDEYYWCIEQALKIEPNITMDDGGDLITTLHTKQQNLIENVIGGTEETTTGVKRQRAMEKEGILRYPVVAVNDAMTKYLFDNRYGTGQSTIDGILRATSLLLAGKNFVIIGYGWCGKGLARRAAGMGAKVIVCEVDEIKALEAAMDGFQVMPIREAAKVGDIFVTVTGNKHVIDAPALQKMKDGAILANSGHFDNEINVEWLEENAIAKEEIRDNVMEYKLKDGRKIYLLAEGRLVNLAAAEGHPPDVMDMSFSNQALVVKWLIENKGKLENKVYRVPEEIDREVARRKLKTMDIEIDELTEEQIEYLRSWKEGT